LSIFSKFFQKYSNFFQNFPKISKEFQKFPSFFLTQITQSLHLNTSNRISSPKTAFHPKKNLKKSPKFSFSAKFQIFKTLNNPSFSAKITPMKNCHLVIMKKPYLQAILAGRKTIESRFYKRKPPEFAMIAPGDTLFLKIASGPVIAKAKIKKLRRYENLSKTRISSLKMRYNDKIIAPADYWQQRSAAKFAFLIWLTEIIEIEPRKISKKDLRAWVPLTAENNFGLLTAKNPL